VKCDSINNKNSAGITMGTYIMSFVSKNYIVKVFIVECNLSVKLKKVIFTLHSPCILIQLAVLKPTNALFVFLLHFYPTYVSAVFHQKWLENECHGKLLHAETSI
jgi:hypothetical protein